MKSPDPAAFVHAYQAFEPGQAAMTFGDIEARFVEVWWPGPKAENTLKGYASKLVMAAQTSIDENIDRLESMMAYQTGHIVDLAVTTDRVRKFYHRMLARTRLRSLFTDPEQVVERAVRALMDEARKIVEPADYTRQENQNAWGAYLSFIKYVCGGLSYVKFMNGFTSGDTAFEADRGIRDLEAIVYYLEKVFPTTSPDDWSKDQAEDLEILKSVVNGKTRIPRNAKEQMKTFCLTLNGGKPDFAAAGSEAARTVRLLKRHWLDMKIEKLMRSMDFVHMAQSLESFFTATVRDTAEVLEAHVRNPGTALQSLVDPGDLPDGDFSINAEYVRLLGNLQSGLRQYMEILENPKRHVFAATRALEKALVIVNKELKRPKQPERLLSQKLENILLERSGPPVIRKIRPYELFLFAHQNDILTRELTATRAKLNPEFEPTDPWGYSFSILAGHEGVDRPDSGTD